jgi:serine/threonine-protein kinase
VVVKISILPPRFRRPELIGRGGMGDIYRATDSVLGRVVAIKILAERFAEDTSVPERFTREALTAARL